MTGISRGTRVATLSTMAMLAAGQAQAQATMAEMQAKAEARIKVTNAAPRGLDVQVKISDAPRRASDPTADIKVGFFEKNKFVKVDSGTVVAVNGTALAFNVFNGYSGRVPAVAAGESYALTYVKAGESTTIATVTVPPRPAISAPVVGDSLIRGKIKVKYEKSTGTEMTGVVSGPRVAGKLGFTGGGVKPDNGTFDFDASSLAPGDGTLAITRHLQWPDKSTGFRSATISFDITKEIAVVWK